MEYNTKTFCFSFQILIIRLKMQNLNLHKQLSLLLHLLTTHNIFLTFALALVHYFILVRSDEKGMP